MPPFQTQTASQQVLAVVELTIRFFCSVPIFLNFGHLSCIVRKLAITRAEFWRIHVQVVFLASRWDIDVCVSDPETVFVQGGSAKMSRKWQKKAKND